MGKVKISTSYRRPPREDLARRQLLRLFETHGVDTIAALLAVESLPEKDRTRVETAKLVLGGKNLTKRELLVSEEASREMTLPHSGSPPLLPKAPNFPTTSKEEPTKTSKPRTSKPARNSTETLPTVPSRFLGLKSSSNRDLRPTRPRARSKPTGDSPR